ncbi:radical SAM protein [bacterium]|nr:radical SAM protein [bacterium]
MKPLKAYLNFLTYQLNRATHRTPVDNFPVLAFVDPTLFCNLRCPACPTGVQAGLRPKATLQWELYQKFMDEVGDYLFKLYLYNLGEPLLHKQAPEMIRYAKEKEIFVMLSSNLSLHLSDESIQKLILSGLDVLIVALDGITPETYQKYRRQGDFDLVTGNMKRIQAMKRVLGYQTPTIIWQFLIFQHNEHEIDTVCKEYKAWGADEYFMGGAYMPVGDMAAGFSPSTLPRYNIYDTTHLHRKKAEQAAVQGKACSWLYGATVLNPNGKISPCSYTAAEKDDFGEYSRDQDFLSVWNGEQYARARKFMAQKDGAWRGPDSWEAILQRINGRGMSVPLQPGQILCERCPVPILQDALDQELTFEPSDLFQYIERTYELSPEERQQLEFLKTALTPQ